MPSNKAQAASYKYVDVPIYEPTADYTAGYIWLCDGSNWMLIWWQCSFAAEYSISPEEIFNVPLQFYFGIDKNGTVDQKVHIYLSPLVDVGDLDYLTIRVNVIGSSLPSRTYMYENTDPGAFPSISLSNGLYTVQNLHNVTFLGAGNVGAVTFSNRTGSISTSYHLNSLSLPRFLDNHVFIDGGNLNIGMDNQGQTAIEDAIDSLNNASDKLSSLAESLQVDKPNISTQPSIIINDSTYTALASLSPLLQADFVTALLVGSLTISLAFILLRGTKE